ncbi:MAG TPA: RNA polymerase sigma factor [archaeon]|nr:RNA polymerase sigma factor [archaeon]
MRKRTINEGRIVSEVLKGNENALREFIHHFQSPLYSYILRRINDRSDAEEVMQDTLLATVEGFRDFSFRSSLFTFICSIANHKIIDFYRKRKIKQIVFSRLEGIEPLLSTLLGPEEALDEEMLRQKIHQTFDALAPKYRQILKLKYVYGYSVEEIAAQLSISFKSAESTLFRARRAFVLAYSV